MEFKVIALSVGGSGNKIFRLGDTVTENQFPKGNAEILVAKGFLELVKKPAAETKVESPKGDVTSFNPNSNKKPSDNKKK